LAVEGAAPIAYALVLIIGELHVLEVPTGLTGKLLVKTASPERPRLPMGKHEAPLRTYWMGRPSRIV
jgi:hypothetical protein